MRTLLSSLALMLVACDSPSPWMRDALRHEVTLEGYRFTVWQQGQHVEIIRHGHAPRSDQPALRPLMARAARQATGCALHPGSLEGDTGVLRARLACDKTAQAASAQVELAQDQGERM